MKRIFALLLISCPLAAAAAEWRYDGWMPVPQAGQAAAEATGVTVMPAATLGGNVPANSMTMPVVRKSFGEPEKVLDGVGEPPITRWQYPEYVVYFENDQVITAVAGHW